MAHPWNLVVHADIKRLQLFSPNKIGEIKLKDRILQCKILERLFSIQLKCGLKVSGLPIDRFHCVLADAVMFRREVILSIHLNCI